MDAPYTVLGNIELLYIIAYTWLSYLDYDMMPHAESPPQSHDIYTQVGR